MPAEIRHIVFDIGNVLLHYDAELPYLHLIPDDAEREHFLTNVCTTAWNVEQDRGRTWEEAEAELIAEYPEHETLIRAWRKYWHEMVPHHYEESVALFEKLIDDGRDVTMLTNFASDTFREAEKRFTFLQRPRGVTVSGDVGLIKPDPAIFALHTETFELEPAATLFIDDSEKNITAAREFGWQAVHFTNEETLKADLERFSLLP